MRISVPACVLAVGLFCSTAAHADTIYNLTLSPTSGPLGGSGSISFNVAPSTSSGKVTTYTPGGKKDDLESFSISIGGQTFDLSNAGSAPISVVFTGGTLTSITYGGSIGNTAFQIAGLQYGDITLNGFNSSFSQGNVSVASVSTTTATPEPSSLALLGSGLLCVVGVVKRRMVP